VEEPFWVFAGAVIAGIFTPILDYIEELQWLD